MHGSTSLVTLWLWSWTSCRHCSSKVLTVQVVHTDLLQFVHFRYCRSPSLMHQPVYTWRWNSCGFTASFVGLLSASASLCCANPCKALCFSDVQPKEEVQVFVFCCSNLLMNTWKSKNHIHRRHKRAAVTFSPLSCCRHVRLCRHLNIKVVWHCCLSRCFQVDDFTISILDKIREIAQYPSAIRQMLWTACP